MRTIRLAFALVVGLTALFIVGIASAEFYQSSLATHIFTGGEYKTRFSQTYSDFTNEGVTMGASYLYVKPVHGCIDTRIGWLQDGEAEPHPPDVEPTVILPHNLCSPKVDTYTYPDWQGDTFEHGAQGGIVVQSFVYSGSVEGDKMGWTVWWLEDESIDAECGPC